MRQNRRRTTEEIKVGKYKMLSAIEKPSRQNQKLKMRRHRQKIDKHRDRKNEGMKE